MNHLLRPRIWPSFSPSCRLYEPEAWRPRVFLRQAQDRLTLRRTVQVRLGSNPAVSRDCPARGASACAARGTPIFFALAALRSVPQAGSQFRVLATPIHEISGQGYSFLTLGENLIVILGSRFDPHEILCQSEIQ